MVARLLSRIFELVFPDPIRPVEFLSLAFLFGWAQQLARAPETLARDSYSAFGVLPAPFWAAIMTLIALMHVVAMLPGAKGREQLRFVSMTAASGIWTIVAIGLWASETTTTGLSVYTAFAIVTWLAGVWLGWASRNSRST